MRLLFLILALLVGSRGWAQVSVCASGCNVTSFLNAQATATATPNEVILISGPITEAGSIASVNTSLTVKSLNFSKWYMNTTSPNIAIGVGMASPLTVMGINFTHDTGNANVFQWNNLAAGGNIALIANSLTSNQADAVIASTDIFTTSNQFFIERCSVIKTGNPGGFGINLTGADITAGTVLIQNCLINDPGGVGGINLGGVSANVAYKIYNNDVIGCSTGFISTGAYDGKNNVFTGNTTDMTNSTSATNAMMQYSGFTTNVSSPGTGSITITAARTYSDPNKYYISPASLTKNAGISINGLTGTDTGLNGILQGSGGIIGMGCNPYSLALCGGYGVGK